MAILAEIVLSDSEDDIEIVSSSLLPLKPLARRTPPSDGRDTSTGPPPKKRKKSSASASPVKGKRLLSELPTFDLGTPSPEPEYCDEEQDDSQQAGPSTGRVTNAFTTLMEGHALETQWSAAQASDKQKGRLPKGEERTVPFYKWVGDLEILVDSFRNGSKGVEGCRGYFLSHAHSDHYQSLNSSWTGGKIYSSATTLNLIKIKLSVKDEYLVPLALNTPIQVFPDLTVTLIDANHCPGSVVFLFEGTKPKDKSKEKRVWRYLHCGDFRACPSIVRHPALRTAEGVSDVNLSNIGKSLKRLDACYLDTTYLDPKYCFPPQEHVIQACVQLVVHHARKCGHLPPLAGEDSEAKPATRGGLLGWLGGASKDKGNAKAEEDEKPKKQERLLVLVGTYSIGKERVAKAIALALGTKIYGTPYKQSLLLAQVDEDPVLKELITDDPFAADVHLCELSSINGPALADYLAKVTNPPNVLPGAPIKQGFTRAIGFRPTGWTYKSDVPRGGANWANGDLARILEKERRRPALDMHGLYEQRDSTERLLAFGVPYSEHSSFYELSCFALSLNYTRIIPTVNVGNPTSRGKMNTWFDRWMSEKKRRWDKEERGEVVPRDLLHW